MKKLTILFFVASLFCLSSCENDGTTSSNLKDAIKLVDNVKGDSIDNAIKQFKAFGANEIVQKWENYYCFYGMTNDASGHVTLARDTVNSVDFSVGYYDNTFSKAKAVATTWIEQLNSYYRGKHTIRFCYARYGSNRLSKVYDYDQACETLKNIRAIESGTVKFIMCYRCGRDSLHIRLEDFYTEESVASITFQ